MLAAFLNGLKLKSAAKRFARELPPQLLRDYGASKFYTPQQIETSAGRAGLPARYVSLGWAMFLDAATFASVADANAPGSYQELRPMLARYAARRSHAGFQPASENTDAFAGSDVWPSP